jgi:hypothetical protein
MSKIPAGYLNLILNSINVIKSTKKPKLIKLLCKYNNINLFPNYNNIVEHLDNLKISDLTTFNNVINVFKLEFGINHKTYIKSNINTDINKISIFLNNNQMLSYDDLDYISKIYGSLSIYNSGISANDILKSLGYDNSVPEELDDIKNIYIKDVNLFIYNLYKYCLNKLELVINIYDPNHQELLNLFILFNTYFPKNILSEIINPIYNYELLYSQSDLINNLSVEELDIKLYPVYVNHAGYIDINNLKLQSIGDIDVINYFNNLSKIIIDYKEDLINLYKTRLW